MSFVTVPAVGQYGYAPDALPQELPPNAWSNTKNIRFRNGTAERFGGSVQVLNTPSVVPYWITPYRNGTSKYWVYAGIARAYVDDGVTKTDLTPASPYTGAIDDRWTGGSASGVLVINNGIDQPQFWGGNVATPFANLTGWNSAWRCASLRPFKQYIVALDITKSGTRYGNMVKWSAAAVPGSLPSSWDETDATKDAGEQDLAETTDLLVDQLQLGDINVIYKERSMYGMQYIDQPYIWRFFRLPGDVGMLARGCAVNTPKGHVVLTAGDLILHSGQGPQSIIEGRIRKWLFNAIDATNFKRSFLCKNEVANEVWVCIPESGHASCTLALVWNWNDDTLCVRQLNSVTYADVGQVKTGVATWSTETRVWSADTRLWGDDGFISSQGRLLMTATDPLILVTETGATFNGTTPTCYLERTGITLDKPDVVKTVKQVVPRVDAAAGTVLTIQVGASMDAEKGVTWGNPVTYTVGTSRKADVFATGRFLAIRITSTANSIWRLKSYDLDVIEHGAY